MAGIANWTDMEWDGTEDAFISQSCASRVAARSYFTFSMSVCELRHYSGHIPCDFILVQLDSCFV